MVLDRQQSKQFEFRLCLAQRLRINYTLTTTCLARRISDQDLPNAFYDSTFTTTEGSPQRSAEEGDDLAMMLDHKMQDSFIDEDEGGEGEEYREGDGDGDEDLVDGN